MEKKLKRTEFLVLAVCLAFGAGPSASASPYSATEIKSVQSDEEGKIADLRAQEITQLKIALGRRLPTNRQAELYLRLAELYLESYRARFLLEGRVHEKRLQEGKNDPHIDRTQSRPYLALGLKSCQEILKFNIPFDRLDQVYYFLGFNYAELGKRDESTRYFERLATEFPRSIYVSDAERELGDAAFDANEYRKALEYYERASGKGKELGARHARVLHKLAWSYYKTRQFDRAVETMKKAIAHAIEGGEKLLSLREEALRDMAIFLTETGQVDAATRYFEKVADREFYPKTLEKLARHYERNVEPLKAVQVYESFLKTDPGAEAAFRARVKLVDLDLRRGRLAEALKRFDGAIIIQDGAEETRTAFLNLKAMVRRTATDRHGSFRKKANREDGLLAANYYTAYLDQFLEQKEFRKEIPEIRMYLAELKKDLGEPKEASLLYRKVVESGDTRYVKEAAVLELSSLGEAIRKSPNSGAEPSALELEFVRAVDELAEPLIEMPEGREGALKAAQILAGYKSSQKELVGRIRKIIEKWPNSAQALTAARLWVQLYADQLAKVQPSELGASDAAKSLLSVMKELRANATLLAEDQSKGGGKLKLLLSDQDTRFKIAAIALDEKKQNFAEAGKGYEAFAAESSKSEVAEKAYASAVSSYLKVQDYPSILRVVGAWLKRFPQSKQPVSAVRSAATEALILGKFADSAELFYKLGAAGADLEALLTAARLYEGIADSTRYQGALSLALKFYKKSPQMAATVLAAARSYEAAGKESEASKQYQVCMQEGAEFAAECGAKLADLYFRLKDTEKAKSIFKKGAAFSGRALSPYVAYARFRLAELSEGEREFPPLELPDIKLKKALNARVAFLTPISKAYLAAVEAGGAFGVAALDRLASWVHAFANEVDRISPPADATPEGAAHFRISLNRISEPLRQRAIQTWRDALQNATDNEILSPRLPAMLDRFSELKLPTSTYLPARAQGVYGRFRLSGVPSDGGKQGRWDAIARVRANLLRNPEDASAWVDYGNLLWGENKPLLSKIAYERASVLDAKNTAALNNRGVLAAQDTTNEEWVRAAQAMAFFREALKHDDFFIAAKMNRALLLNYYRLFGKAKPLWEQVNLKVADADAQDGLAVALQATNNLASAKEAFKKATSLGASSRRFALLFHEAVLKPPAEAEDCLEALSDLEEGELLGFEKESVERLKRTCTLWKNTKK